MALIDPPMLRDSFETDASDLALQRIIDDAEETIITRFGPHQQTEDTFSEEQYGTGIYLFPSRPVDNIVSVVEYGRTPFANPDVGLALAANDYQLVHGGMTLKRLVTGDNPLDYWGPRVILEYVPVGQLARRTRVGLDLCKLALTYRGLIKTEQAGDYRSGGPMTPEAYRQEREALLSELQRAMSFA